MAEKINNDMTFRFTFLVAITAIFSSNMCYTQWQNSGSIVQLNNSNRSKSVQIADSEEGLQLGKLSVRGNPDDYLNDVLVYFSPDQNISSSHTLMSLSVSAYPSGNPTILQGLRGTSSEAFHFDYNGNQRLRGALSLLNSGGVGTAIRVNNDQAIWYNGSEFSWGFGGVWNRFADPISLGASGQPSSGVGLQIGESMDIRFMGSQTKSLIFRNGANTGTLSEISSGQNFLRIHDLTQIFLNAGNKNLITLHGLAQRVDIDGNLDISNKSKIQWSTIHGNSQAEISYDQGALTLNTKIVNEDLILSTNSGGITITDGSDQLTFSGGNLGIGYETPMYPLHVNGNVGVDGEFYALSDKRMKEDISTLDPRRVEQIFDINPVKFKWKHEQDENYSIGVIAQEIEVLFPEAVMTDENGIKRVQYDIFGVLAIEAIKKLRSEIDAQNKRMDSHELIINNLVSKMNNSRGD